MKQVVFLLAMVTLSGCASHTPELQQPYYDAGFHAIIADDYSVSRIDLPDSYDIETGGLIDDAYVFRSFDAKNQMLRINFYSSPLPSDRISRLDNGYGSAKARLKSRHVYYMYFRGLLSDLTPEKEWSSAVVCGVGVGLTVVSESDLGGLSVAYVEPRDCSAMKDFGNYQQYQLRHKVYNLLGLK